MVDLLGGPAADMTAAMQEDFEQADDAGVVDLDPGIADRADGDRQGEALQQRKVDVDIEPLRLEAGKAIGDGLEVSPSAARRRRDDSADDQKVKLAKGLRRGVLLSTTIASPAKPVLPHRHRRERGTGRLEPRIATRLAGPRVGAFESSVTRR